MAISSIYFCVNIMPAGNNISNGLKGGIEDTLGFKEPSSFSVVDSNHVPSLLNGCKNLLQGIRTVKNGLLKIFLHLLSNVRNL